MCEVDDRFEGLFATWREAGVGLCRPVNVWLSGADWTTRSFANWEAEGGTIDSPAGRFFEVVGVFESKRFDSDGFTPSGPSPFAVFCNRDSIIDLCWSRTEILRCNCSLIVGS